MTEQNSQDKLSSNPSLLDSEQALLPCAHCGGRGNLIVGLPPVPSAFIDCYLKDGGCGMATGIFDTAEEAIAAWNRRAAISQAPAVPEGWREVIEHAAIILEGYAQYIRNDVPSLELERHPYQPMVEHTAEQLRAMIAAAPIAAPQDRNAIIEECAKVCEQRYMGDNNREDAEAKRCAAALRALKTAEGEKA